MSKEAIIAKLRWRNAGPKFGVCTEDGERTVAYIPPYDGDTEEYREAVKDLIAAAPSLYEALARRIREADEKATAEQAANSGWDYSKGSPPPVLAKGWDRERAILAKARGEQNGGRDE